jgi:Tle cognate immunity protein 4 C-terminal domain
MSLSYPVAVPVAVPVARSIRAVFLFAAVVAETVGVARAAPSLADPKDECVGRIQLSLPGEADIAATSEKTLAGELVRGSAQPATVFADGQRAGYSYLGFGGVLLISHPVDTSAYAAMATKLRVTREGAKNRVRKNPTEDNGDRLEFAIPQTKSPSSVAWRVNGAYALLVRVGDSSIYWSGNAAPIGEAAQIVFADIEQAQPRQIFSVPAQTGVCAPYVFIPDGGQRGRDIRVTYRLKEQPDVTVWLADSNASTPRPDQIASHFTPEYKTNFFWTQRYQSRKSVKMLWHHLHDVKLDGRKGVASFVELTREDDTIDYGYLAVVRGDPDAKTDAPDLMLYVIRDAKNAIAKGKQPIDKAEFLEMAEAIAASVKHRPTQ